MPNLDLPSDEERRQAEIASRYIDPAYTASLEGITPDSPPQRSSTTPRLNREEQEQESSLKLQGGDIHRDVYKLSARASPIQRAQTFSHVGRPIPIEGTVAAQNQPGGFRRQYLLRKQRQLNSVTSP